VVSRFPATDGGKGSIGILGNTAAGPTVELRDCVCNDLLKGEWPLSLGSGSGDTIEPSGFRFNNVIVNTDRPCQPLGFSDQANTGKGVYDVTGELTLVVDGASAVVPLNQAILRQWMPNYSDQPNKVSV
jgi:hypothetical protein